MSIPISACSLSLHSFIQAHTGQSVSNVSLVLWSSGIIFNLSQNALWASYPLDRLPFGFAFRWLWLQLPTTFRCLSMVHSSRPVRWQTFALEMDLLFYHMNSMGVVWGLPHFYPR